ncbi:hypothetical protein CBR_g31816 [Chara braunii]|uniref:Integrase catalytic domain-containing protein n=1 Tax=Chara braunii TaxID=69332 RepID=A0A388LFP2_CHABU|nr:hypothetical protein CBR_g31816 [Chara braunii]|eukprot:GBG81140.1 hypothetical protein CBR_g31816 [Chara braunii]
MAESADSNAPNSPKRPVTPPMPVQQADETQLAFFERLKVYSETTAAELRKWEEEEAARQQATQRQLAEAEAARKRAATEAAAAARLQQQQLEASQNQVRYQATLDLSSGEATYGRLLRKQHFHATAKKEEPTDADNDKEGIAILMENLLYTCNWQQRELLAIRQVLIRHEATLKPMDQKIATLQSAQSVQQDINDQLQDNVSTGMARLSAVESLGCTVPDSSPALAAQAKQLEERINHLVASLGDISKFAGASTVSIQLQTLNDRVQQRTTAVVKEWKMPNFKIEKFDDYHKTDPLQWWMGFNAEADVHHTPPLRRMDALYLQLISGAQAFMTHMAVTLECTIATLHTKITWEEFEKKWKTRFMVNNDKRHTLNKIFCIFQGQHLSREWLTEWQRLVATPELNLPFDSIRGEFFTRSCDALTVALGSEFQYENFDDMIAKARELIRGNRCAANETRPQPGYVEKSKGQRTPHVAAVQQGPSEDHAAASTSSDGDVAAAIPLRSTKPRGGKKAKEASANGARQEPWAKSGLTEEMFKMRQKWGLPPPSTDGGVAVVDLRDYLAKIDREYATQRYVDNDAPLLYIRIQIGKATFSALIDCGASRNYISQDFMTRDRLGPRVRRKSQPTHVTLADGHTQKSIDRCVDSVPVYFAPLACEAVSFDILDNKFDMILGMSWLQSEDHPVNFFHHTVHVRDRRGELVPCTVPPPHPSIGCHVVSAASIRQSIIRHDVEEMGICFLHALPPIDQPKTDTSDPRVIELLDSYEDVFQAPAGVVPDRPIRHGIPLEDGAVPPRGCIYRMSEEELQALRAQLDDLLAKGWIRPSCSPYGVPVLFVRKKNKDLRLCIDYRKLNAQTIKNAGPLPRIDDLLERLGGAKYFSKLNLKSGYHQIEIQPRDRYKTAFKTRYGHFEWIIMPFGLTNAPTTFQAAMTTEFRDLLDRSVLIYLDDILVYSRSLDEHLGHLRAVLDRLRIAKYKSNRDKCEFAHHGVSEDIVSDRDTRFMSSFWTALMVESDTSMKPSSTRHPQTDGQTERAHQSVQMMLRTLIRPDQKDWVDRLPDIEFAYNTSVHPTIGVTPFKLHHGGRKGRIFADILLPRAADIDAACSPASTRKYRELLAKARANMQKAQVRMQQQANRRRLPCPIRGIGSAILIASSKHNQRIALQQAREREARALRRRMEKAGGGGGDADDERMILDFRFGFEGSVFERLHVSPVQLAELILLCHEEDADLFHEFISEPGRISLMKESVDDFGANFKDYCRTKGLAEKDAVLLADMATNFAAELLHGKNNDDDNNDDSDSSDWSDEEEDTPGTEVEEISMLFLRHWVSNLSPQFGPYLGRWGRNVNRESDQTISRKIYTTCEKKIRSEHKKPLGAIPGFLSGSLVDFDLVDADGRKYPLRMLKFIGMCENPNIWYAHIRERETGALIAKVHNNSLWEEHVRVVAEELIERQYKPHGDIPTMLRGWFTPGSPEYMRRTFAVRDDGVGKNYAVSSPEGWHLFLPC